MSLRRKEMSSTSFTIVAVVAHFRRTNSKNLNQVSGDRKVEEMDVVAELSDVDDVAVGRNFDG